MSEIDMLLADMRIFFSPSFYFLSVLMGGFLFLAACHKVRNETNTFLLQQTNQEATNIPSIYPKN